MRRTAAKIGIFLGLNLAIYVMALYWVEAQFEPNPEPWETESLLHAMPANKTVDLLMLGTSHARGFTHYCNHRRVENLLGLEMVNLGKNGMGPLPTKIFLEYFFAQGNRAKQVLYVVDHFAFHNRLFNKDFRILFEPVRMSILWGALTNGMHPRILLLYMKENFLDRYKRWEHIPESNEEVLRGFDEKELRKEVLDLYRDSGDLRIFRRSAEELETIIRLSQAHGSKVILIIPSQTFVYNEKDKALWLALLDRMKTDYGVEYYDLRASIPDQRMFADYHHLNTRGIVHFTKEFLKPILEGRPDDIVLPQ